MTEKRGRGRPKFVNPERRKDVRVTVNLTETEAASLDQLRNAQLIPPPRSAVVEAALRMFLKQQGVLK